MDYLGVPFSLTFTEAGTQFVNISILDDDLVEQPEDIQLLITSSTLERTLINSSPARVRIIDSDGERDSVILAVHHKFFVHSCSISVLHGILQYQ